MGGESNLTHKPAGLTFFVNFTRDASSAASSAEPYELTVGARPADASYHPPKQRHPPLPLPRLSTLRMSPSDTTLSVRVYVDNTVAECFFQGGRTTLSVATTPDTGVATGEAAAVGVSASGGGVRLAGAVVWAVEPIWVEAETLRGSEGGLVDYM